MPNQKEDSKRIVLNENPSKNESNPSQEKTSEIKESFFDGRIDQGFSVTKNLPFTIRVF